MKRLRKFLVAGLFVFAFAEARAGAELDSRLSDIVASRCALCHGADGRSASPIYPRLAAQHPDYLAKQLKDFRDGRRKSDTMTEMARDLQDPDIAGLAAFFASKPAGARQPGDADFVAIGRFIYARGNPYSGLPACASCHGPRGHGTQQLPRLAGQHPAYLETQLRDFSKRERTNDNAVMHTVATKLTELELRAVATYVSSLD